MVILWEMATKEREKITESFFNQLNAYFVAFYL